MSPTTAPPKTPSSKANTADKEKVLKPRNHLLHYAAYFVSASSLVFIAQTDEPKQFEDALLAGGIASLSVVSRDWFKARLSPSMTNDPDALITLFSEMLHAGRAQANTNAAHLKRVEFLQVDLVDAMRDFNDLLRLSPEEIEKRLRTVQNANLTSALPVMDRSPAVSNEHAPFPASDTHVPDSTTVRQSFRQRRPGFDA